MHVSVNPVNSVLATAAQVAQAAAGDSALCKLMIRKRPYPVVAPTAASKGVKYATSSLASAAYTNAELEAYFHLTPSDIERHRGTEDLIRKMKLISASIGLLGGSLEAVGTVSE